MGSFVAIPSLYGCQNRPKLTQFNSYSDNLLAGVKQEIEVTLHTGSSPILSDSKVKVIPSDDLDLDTGNPDNTVIVAETPRGGTVGWKMYLTQKPHPTAGKTLQNKVY